MSAAHPTIAPHGGTLVHVPRGPRRDGPALRLDAVALADLEMLAVGAYSPLSGFMSSLVRESVASTMRLPTGLVWPIPITLAAPAAFAQKRQVGEHIVLQDDTGHPVGELHLEEVYQRDPADEARQVFGTADAAHPGVAQLLERGRWCLAGPVTHYEPVAAPGAASNAAWLTPSQTRAEFAARGWRRVVGFQTRNPIHRAHEYILKCAMEICDGLLLHPLVGATKGDDVPVAVRLQCYRALMDSALPAAHVVFAGLPAPMRYAGPREAVLHALVRQNYGCTHFIVGRDHAGVGAYYGTYDAHKIFGRFAPGELGITPLFFEHAFYCRPCGQMASSKTCPHGPEHHVTLSGTKVRDMLRQGERPPAEFTRPEVADILIAWARP